MPKTYVTIACRVPEEISKALDLAAAKSSRSKASVIKEALIVYLSGQGFGAVKKKVRYEMVFVADDAQPKKTESEKEEE